VHNADFENVELLKPLMDINGNLLLERRNESIALLGSLDSTKMAEFCRNMYV
jgi:hypothetical protein